MDLEDDEAEQLGENDFGQDTPKTKAELKKVEETQDKFTPRPSLKNMLAEKKHKWRNRS